MPEGPSESLSPSPVGKRVQQGQAIGDSDRTMKRAGGTRKMGCVGGRFSDVWGLLTRILWGALPIYSQNLPALSLSHPKYAPPHQHLKSSHTGTLGLSHSLCPSPLAQIITAAPSCCLSLSWRCQLHAVAKLFFLTPPIAPQAPALKYNVTWV